MIPSGASSSPQPHVELLDLLRRTFHAVAAEPDGVGRGRLDTGGLAEAARRHGAGNPAQLLPLIRAAWASLPGAEAQPLERREALLHRIASTLIATHYEHR